MRLALPAQAQLVQHHGAHLLRLIAKQHGTAGGGSQVIEPADAQRLEVAPAGTDADRDAEDVTALAVEVRVLALRLMHDADGEVR
jgi:hypothetical protein